MIKYVLIFIYKYISYDGPNSNLKNLQTNLKKEKKKWQVSPAAHWHVL